MNRIKSYERKYGRHAAEVLSSLGKVARAGQYDDPERLEAERERHRDLMAEAIPE
jgi:hypothetical protein